MLQPRRDEGVVALLCCRENRHHRFAVVVRRHEPARSGAGESQADDATRLLQREVERGAAAERMSDQMCAIDLQMVEQQRQVASDVVRLVHPPRLAEGAQVVANDPVAFGERRDLQVPAAAVHERPMDKHDRLTRADGVVHQFSPGHGNARRRWCLDNQHDRSGRD
jgi:hypothetical protein